MWFVFVPYQGYLIQELPQILHLILRGESDVTVGVEESLQIEQGEDIVNPIVFVVWRGNNK